MKIAAKRHRSISVCRGEAQINLHADGTMTFAGPAGLDLEALRFMCRDGLRDKIAFLNAKLDLCYEALNEGMKNGWWRNHGS
jgi:hypothetical protein